MTNEITNDYMLNFYSEVCAWGYRDIQRAVEVYKEAGLYPQDLASDIKESSESWETPLDKIDVCFVAYDSILQKARNKIDTILDFDFSNDGADIEVYGNYLCTSYNYSDDQKEKLKEVLEKATEEQKQELKENKPTAWFLGELELLEVLK